MRRHVCLVTFAVLALFGVASAGDDDSVDPGKAVTYCGELRLGIVADGMVLGEMSFHLLNSGGPFKVVHGILVPEPSPDDPDFKPVLFSGTGQLVEIPVGSEIHPVFFVSGIMSQEHFPDQDNYRCWLDGRVTQFSLDLAENPAAGSIWNVGVDYNECAGGGTPFDLQYGRYTIAAVGELPKCLANYVR